MYINLASVFHPRHQGPREIQMADDQDPMSSLYRHFKFGEEPRDKNVRCLMSYYLKS